jgi:2-oxoglutarate ferredoxin oxidoreductase subunit alpha
MGIPPDLFRRVITRKFEPKGQKVLDANLKSFDAGYAYVLETFSDRISDSLRPLQEPEDIERVMLSGNEAIGRGAVDAGLKLYFGYPITPATPIMEYLAKKLPEKGGAVVQMEDEIASISAVIGASFAGARSMTATSGPGFALMTEMIGHGVMTETPAVILDAQRGGPSTGLPTKTEQSDLQAAVRGGPGDSARIVIAPTNVAECYHLTVKSFQFAEKYQTPVIVLTDFYLDNRVENLEIPVAKEEDTADWNIYPDETGKGNYKRYEVTESGISPRAIPGTEGFEFAASGLEHVESGTPDYSPENHMRMSEKRHQKILYALADLPAPSEISSGGNLDVGVITWGSTTGAVIEAVKLGRERSLNIAALKLVSIYPYHEVVIREFMDRCEDILIPELNYEGQLANLIGHLHRKDVVRMNRATGTPFAPSEILREIENLLKAGKK